MTSAVGEYNLQMEIVSAVKGDVIVRAVFTWGKIWFFSSASTWLQGCLCTITVWFCLNSAFKQTWWHDRLVCKKMFFVGWFLARLSCCWLKMNYLPLHFYVLVAATWHFLTLTLVFFIPAIKFVFFSVSFSFSFKLVCGCYWQLKHDG